MKHSRIYIGVFCIALGALFASLLVDGWTTRGQSQRVAPGAKSPNSRAAAAARNAILVNDLVWIFGSKPQRGWYLYKPLINRLLHTKHDVASEDFASALASWQKKVWFETKRRA